MQLTQEQQRIFEAVESSASNFFITGKPGVGKSVLIRALVEQGKKHYTLAAPTGLAAININGKTLHSLFQIPVSRGALVSSYNNYTTNQQVISHIKYRVHHLIIDECSMVRADMLDYIDRLLQHIKGNDLPFGGVQMILVGDFYQLPPVAQAQEQRELKDDGYLSPFLFHARSFASFKTLELTTVMRQQGDDKFLEILEAARGGKPSFKQIADLNRRLKDYNGAIRLTSTNKEADLINQTELKKLGEGRTYTAKYSGEWPVYPLPEHLTLSIGAQVMVKVNGADMKERNGFSNVVNGTLGIVKEMHDDYVTITLSNGNDVDIHVQTLYQKVKQQINGKWSEIIVATFTQIPLQLAWAISIHKSQGQTFEKCCIDAKRIFAPGQLYVALSRCRSLDGIVLTTPLLKKHFFVNPLVVKFYKSLKS